MTEAINGQAAILPKDETAIPIVERRIAELQQQRLQAQEMARQQDAGYQGAIQAMVALKEELVAMAEADGEEEE